MLADQYDNEVDAIDKDNLEINIYMFIFNSYTLHIIDPPVI